MGEKRPLRVTFIAGYRPAETTGIVRSMLLGLHEMSCAVQEINLWGTRKYTYNPDRRTGGFGPVYVRLERIKRRVRGFEPDAVLLCGGGLTFTHEDMAHVRKRCPVVGVTLSDPDVFPTVSEYAGLFTHHTTNSTQALEWYLRRGTANTSLMPFGVDSRFFVPQEADEGYRTDVAVVGHGRPDRLELAGRLRREFGARVYGRNWPWADSHPIQGKDWFRAVRSARFVVNFPRTVAGYANVKVGVFEAAATGRLLFTERFEEMESYFRYDEEIVGYSGADDLVSRLRHFLDHPAEAELVARAGQLRCARDHMWSKRLADLFSRLRLIP